MGVRLRYKSESLQVQNNFQTVKRALNQNTGRRFIFGKLTVLRFFRECFQVCYCFFSPVLKMSRYSSFAPCTPVCTGCKQPKTFFMRNLHVECLISDANFFPEIVHPTSLNLFSLQGFTSYAASYVVGYGGLVIVGLKGAKSMNSILELKIYHYM